VLPPKAVGEIAISECRALRPEKGEIPPGTFTNGWFRTGDLGFIDEEGYVFLTGRIKELINRGGTKVSPQEVESVLLEHPAVAEAVVFAVPHSTLGETVAAAVVLREGAAITSRVLRSFVAERLTYYKVPLRILVLPEIPRGPTGKYQRIGMAQSLGLLVDQPAGTSMQVRRPVGNLAEASSDLERWLITAWEALLNVRPIGVDEDFFDLGGDSLLAVRLLLKIENELRAKVPDSVLYQASTVAELAAAIGEHRGLVSGASVLALKPEGSQLPLFVCLHVGMTGATSYRHLARHIDSERPLFGIQSRGIDRRGFPYRNLEQIAAEYVTEIQRVQPEGPYHLCGYSAAGLIAYEAAQQLVAQGRVVSFLGLLDTGCPGHTEPFAQTIHRHAVSLASLGPRSLSAYLKPRAVRTYQRVSIKLLRAVQGALPGLRIGGRYQQSWVGAATKTAYQNYVAKPYFGRLTLLMATRYPPNLTFFPQLGWQNCAPGEFELRFVPGDHDSLLGDSESRGLATELNLCLRKCPVNNSRTDNDRDRERA
jgi:thioesterase domain-containing protein/acyl carrier protein